MRSPTGNQSTPLNQFTEEDWEALDEVFDALEVVPIEQTEISSSSESVSVIANQSEDDAGTPA